MNDLEPNWRAVTVDDVDKEIYIITLNKRIIKTKLESYAYYTIIKDFKFNGISDYAIICDDVMNKTPDSHVLWYGFFQVYGGVIYD